MTADVVRLIGDRPYESHTSYADIVGSAWKRDEVPITLRLLVVYIFMSLCAAGLEDGRWRKSRDVTTEERWSY